MLDISNSIRYRKRLNKIKFMTIFLYGQDTYRSRKKLNEIIANYKKVHKSGLNLIYFEGKDLDFEGVLSEIQQASIIVGKKMLVLKNVFSNADFK